MNARILAADVSLVPHLYDRHVFDLHKTVMDLSGSDAHRYHRAVDSRHGNPLHQTRHAEQSGIRKHSRDFVHRATSQGPTPKPPTPKPLSKNIDSANSGADACPYHCPGHASNIYDPNFKATIDGSMAFASREEAQACLAKCGGGFTNSLGDTQMCPRVIDDNNYAPCLLSSDDDGLLDGACGFRAISPSTSTTYPLRCHPSYT